MTAPHTHYVFDNNLVLRSQIRGCLCDNTRSGCAQVGPGVFDDHAPKFSAAHRLQAQRAAAE